METHIAPTDQPFQVGDHVYKVRGYRFIGYVTACFRAVVIPDPRDTYEFNLSGTWRVVVQNADGLMHIFDPAIISKLP